MLLLRFSFNAWFQLLALDAIFTIAIIVNCSNGIVWTFLIGIFVNFVGVGSCDFAILIGFAGAFFAAGSESADESDASDDN